MSTVNRRALRLLDLFRPFTAFVRVETLGGTLLLGAAIAALVWANSPYAGLYLSILETPVRVGAGAFTLEKPALLWINDLLMAVFFLVVGLEIKRELVVGELDTPRRALLPAAAAIGGMLVPAAIYAVLNAGGAGVRGWGVPMATDIAFALGVLRLLGPRVPNGLYVFLAALAILDDLGAILVIALFYASELAPSMLAGAAVCAALLLLFNRLDVRRPGLYLLVGLPLWFFVLKSGIHATIAGVIVGLSIPARTRVDTPAIVEDARALLGVAEQKGLGHEEAEEALRALENRFDQAASPLSELEHALHPYVAFAIVPIFALANAGVSLAGLSPSMLIEPVTLGVAAGLVLGKPIGIIGATLLAVRLGWASLPSGVTTRHVVGAGILGGIGFTMSLFVAGLAFEPSSALHVQAKLGILLASVVAGVAGFLVLRSTPAPASESRPA